MKTGWDVLHERRVRFQEKEKENWLSLFRSKWLSITSPFGLGRRSVSPCFFYAGISTLLILYRQPQLLLVHEWSGSAMFIRHCFSWSSPIPGYDNLFAPSSVMVPDPWGSDVMQMSHLWLRTLQKLILCTSITCEFCLNHHPLHKKFFNEGLRALLIYGHWDTNLEDNLIPWFYKILLIGSLLGSVSSATMGLWPDF